jgi:hypothetical protein
LPSTGSTANIAAVLASQQQALMYEYFASNVFILNTLREILASSICNINVINTLHLTIAE